MDIKWNNYATINITVIFCFEEYLWHTGKVFESKEGTVLFKSSEMSLLHDGFIGNVNLIVGFITNVLLSQLTLSKQ